MSMWRSRWRSTDQPPLLTTRSCIWTMSPAIIGQRTFDGGRPRIMRRIDGWTMRSRQRWLSASELRGWLALMRMVSTGRLGTGSILSYLAIDLQIWNT